MLYLLFGLFIAVSVFLSMWKPTAFVIFYVLASTKFLGFFGFESIFIIGGLGLGMFSLNLVTIISSFFPKEKLKLTFRSKQFIVFMIGFILYGIIVPYLSSGSSLLKAITAGKEFWTVGFLLYLIFRKSELNFHLILKFIFYLGIYLSSLEILYLLTKIAPPFYIEFKGYLVVMRIYYPTYISLAIFIFYYLRSKNIKLFLNTSLMYFPMLIGLILTGYTSLVAGTILGVGLLVFRKRINKNPLSLIFTGGFLVIFAVGTFFLFEREFLALFHEFSNDADISLSSREMYNAFRWGAINERPMMGYGFLHPSTELGSQLIPESESLYMQHLGTIDSGYIDLFTKFGYLGSLLYLIIWLRIIIRPIFSLGKGYNYNLSLVASCYLLPYFVINYTWSLFSYSHGLIPGYFAIFLILFADHVEAGFAKNPIDEPETNESLRYET